MTKKLDIRMVRRLAQLKGAPQRFDRNKRISSPKIQRVPIFLRENDKFAKYCSPKVMSFGPIHHATESLKQQGEHYKLLWTSRFVEEYGIKIDKDVNRATQLLHEKVEDKIEELKNLFTEDAIGSYSDSELAWMLFVDGCSLLHFMRYVDYQRPEALNLKLDQLMNIWKDIMLLENQLPRKMLEILCNEMGNNLEYFFSNYHSMGLSKQQGWVSIFLENRKPFHILDSFRSRYLSPEMLVWNNGDSQMVTESEGNERNQSRINPNLKKFTYKNIRDLKRAGIQVMANKSNLWSDISFTSKWFGGELRLPVFDFNDFTPYFFRNLIAYEMCPDVHYNYECCSFFAFMDSLVDSAEDVKELRLAGVFQNLLGSDEDLAKLFNELGDDLPIKWYSNNTCTNAVAYSEKYVLVKYQIEEHYTNKCKTWFAQFRNTHFNTPWTVISFLAASLVVVLTCVQTWCAIKSR